VLCSIHDEIEHYGFATRDGVLSGAEVKELLAAMERVNDTGSVRRRGGIFAVRNLLDVSPEVQGLARSPVVRELVEAVLGTRCFPVRGILFDKIPGANWKVPWHQDVTIAVQNKVEIEGFGPGR
jgi:Phytanoyl-CoA dioxygenase (PhyH)